jgi:hypothetical protein
VWVLSIFVPLEHGVQVEFRYRLATRVLTNRLWFVVVAGDPTTADLTAVSAGVATWATNELLPLLSQDIHLMSVRAYDATVPYPGTFVPSIVGLDGGIADGSHSANIAIKMEFQTQNPPALWLNWNFIAGIPKSKVNLNTIDPTYANDLKNAFVVLLDVFSLFVYRWEATRAVVDGIPLSTRDHFRVDHPRVRRRTVSQRRTRLDNPP